MRMTQFIGLNSYATDLITVEPVLCYVDYIRRVYIDGKEEILENPVYKSPIQIKPSDINFYQDFSEQVPLSIYSLPGGVDYYEIVQHTIWSSGPVIFTALKNFEDEWIESTLWTDKEMDPYL